MSKCGEQDPFFVMKPISNPLRISAGSCIPVSGPATQHFRNIPFLTSTPTSPSFGAIFFAAILYISQHTPVTLFALLCLADCPHSCGLVKKSPITFRLGQKATFNSLIGSCL